MNDLLDKIGAVFLIPLFILFGLGDLYWLWMAVQIESFWMFVIGLFLPAAIVTGPVGAWSLLFGIPNWIHSLFG